MLQDVSPAFMYCLEYFSACTGGRQVDADNADEAAKLTLLLTGSVPLRRTLQESG
jgi:hypothetical protein